MSKNKDIKKAFETLERFLTQEEEHYIKELSKVPEDVLDRIIETGKASDQRRIDDGLEPDGAGDFIKFCVGEARKIKAGTRKLKDEMGKSN